MVAYSRGIIYPNIHFIKFYLSSYYSFLSVYSHFKYKVYLSLKRRKVAKSSTEWVKMTFVYGFILTLKISLLLTGIKELRVKVYLHFNWNQSTETGKIVRKMLVSARHLNSWYVEADAYLRKFTKTPFFFFYKYLIMTFTEMMVW